MLGLGSLALALARPEALIPEIGCLPNKAASQSQVKGGRVEAAANGMLVGLLLSE